MEHIRCANSVVSDMSRPFIAIGSVLVWCSIGTVVSSEVLMYLTSHCAPDVACNKHVTPKTLVCHSGDCAEFHELNSEGWCTDHVYVRTYNNSSTDRRIFIKYDAPVLWKSNMSGSKTHNNNNNLFNKKKFSLRLYC